MQMVIVDLEVDVNIELSVRLSGKDHRRPTSCKESGFCPQGPTWFHKLKLLAEKSHDSSAALPGQG